MASEREIGGGVGLGEGGGKGRMGSDNLKGKITLIM